MQTVSIRIIGRVRGRIWMSAVDCYKDIDARYVRKPRDARIVCHNGITDLRDALLQLTSDGDFRRCELERGAVLQVTKLRHNGYAITRSWELRGTGGNADCFTDPD